MSPTSRQPTCTTNYHRNDLVAAEQHASAVHELRYVTHRLAVTQTAFVLAAIHQARGLPDQARQALAGAEQYLRETRSEALLSLVRAYEAELAAVQGDLATAGRWAATVGPYVPLGIMAFFYAPQLTLAKILLTIDTPASRQQAADELARLYAFVTSTYTTRFTIDVLALQALLHAAEGDEPAALAVLAQAIALAQPGDFIRPFVDLGPRMAHLFAQQARREGSSDYVRQVLGVFPSFAIPSQPHPNTRLRSLPVSQADLVEPLTRRELEILELLVRRLSAKEIAHHLVISDRTVKRHTANIYQKLGVNSRQQAVSTAMALGLLTPAALEQI